MFHPVIQMEFQCPMAAFETPRQQTSFAKYRVIRVIGNGASGQLYLAHDPYIERLVALKLARHITSQDSEGQRRFFRQAQVAGKLKHPNIAAVYDAGIDQDNPYIVMEYIDGEQDLESDCQPERLLPLRDAVSIIYKLAMALDYTHKQSVFHCNLCPGKILMTPDQEVKLIDFGVDQETHLQSAESGISGYRAPEQIRAGTCSAQTDLYALGLVMYRLLTGHHPFAAEHPEQIEERICSESATPASELRPEIPPVLDRIINRALERDPRQRYKTGLDIAGDLSLVFEFLREPQHEISQQEKFDAVEQLGFFRDFSEREVREIINASIWQHIPASEDIILEGQIDKSFYIIVSGQVDVRKGPLHVEQLTAGDCFGEMGFISGRRRTATITTSTQVTLMKVQASLIERASVNCQLRFHKVFLYTLIERLARTTDRFVAGDDPGVEAAKGSLDSDHQ